MFEEQDDTILARWLAGELTKEEAKQFKSSAEYNEYLAIVEGLDRFKKPKFNKAKVFSNLIEKLETPKTKVIKFKPLLYISSIAASLVLLVGLFFNEVTYETGIGEQLQVSLPDGSKINLNAKSKVTRNRFFWKNNKSVTLTGEAVFTVTKGEGFSVKTTHGKVTVLGTVFNLKARSDLFELSCYQGKVAYKEKPLNKEFILVKGNSIKKVNGTIKKSEVATQEPDWITGNSRFNAIPLSQVIDELQLHYHITIEHSKIDSSKLFTGSFVHNNLEQALKTVFVPMGVSYKENNNHIILE